jgi:hypothetical protein
MQIRQASAKLFFRPETTADLEPFIAIFHRWIRDGKLADHLLIDVADYRHVPKGPGIMLIAHEAHVALDAEDGQLGILYVRKRDVPGDPTAKFLEALRNVAEIARGIEAEAALGGAFRADTARFGLGVMSRLHARNDVPSCEALEPHLRSAMAAVGYPEVKMRKQSKDPRRPFAVAIDAISPAVDLASLGL